MIVKTFKNEKGIGLIETLLAIGVGIIVITSMVALAVFTVRASLQSQLALKGSQLASQEIELVRSYRDQKDSWSAFKTGMADCFTGHCSMTSEANVVNSEGEQGTGAKKIVKYFTLEPLPAGTPIDDADIVRVNVTVNWQIGTDPKSAHNYTELSNWRDK